MLEDHELTRRGLCAMINAEPDLLVCGAGAVSGFDPAVLRALRPDVVLLDASANQARAMELIRALREVHHSPARIVALALFRAPKAPGVPGGADLVIETDVAERVVKAVRHSWRRAGKPRHAAAEHEPKPAAAFGRLEREVITMIGAGEPTETMAVRLRVPLRTIQACIRKIKVKAHLRSAVALVRYCVDWRRRRRTG